ncbi:alpha/beta hydrolase [Hamadaea sp. NPDC050747]|uniref:alpha/beta hydrolase n=1 Tax=Hamadaea sp. NPDC050747 TaxID=3155789 RepID=UPI0033CE1402
MPGSAPLRARLVLRDTLDWDAVTDEEVVAIRAKVNRIRASRVARIITGWPDRRTRIEEHQIDLPGRRLTLRVHRPKNAASAKLPLILSLHGGGFIVGLPAQNDWLNSHLAASLPAIVVSVAYRLAPEHPMPTQVDDAYETLARLVGDPFGWGVDPAAVAVFGESAGGTIATLVALRARKDGPPIHAQVLAYPGTDWSETRADYPSVAANGGNPGLSLGEWRTAHRLAIPSTVDPSAVSPVKADNLADLPPALIVVGELDAALDQGRAYAERLRADGSAARLTVYPRAVHGFISTPGLIPAARPARREILEFLRDHLRR